MANDKRVPRVGDIVRLKPGVSLTGRKATPPPFQNVTIRTPLGRELRELILKGWLK